MNVVAAQTDRTVANIIQPTLDAFIPLLEARRAEIETIKRKTFTHGDMDRHQLDVYYPSETDAPVPILFFVYGGGFVIGSRIYSPPAELLYANLGAFFAKRGILTVIPDYRLLPEAHFPEPMEDVRDAIAWVVANIDQVTSERNLKVDLDSIFMMGHSAGATIVSTLLLHPTLLPAPLRARIRGINLAGGEYRQHKDGVMAGIVTQLYGSWDAVEKNMPSALLERLPESIVSGFPDVIMMGSERDPDEVIEANEEWISMLKETLGKDVRLFVMKRHNHFSPMLALWSGDGEEWAVEFDRWMKARVQSSTGQ